MSSEAAETPATRARAGGDPPACDPSGGDVVPDTKDWTWVLEEPCPECGLAAGEIVPERVAERIPAQVRRWQEVLRRPDVRSRPRPGVWSALEYACHVRDVYDLFAARSRLVLETQPARFANWDQDVTAIEKAYASADPAAVAAELALAGGEYRRLLDEVEGPAWSREAIRSNGSRFTLATLTQYFLHDVEHHLHDVAG